MWYFYRLQSGKNEILCSRGHQLPLKNVASSSEREGAARTPAKPETKRDVVVVIVVVIDFLTSQQHACVSQGGICSDNFTCWRDRPGLGTCCNFLTSATSGLPQVAIQIAVLAAHVATLNRSPRNPIPNKENSRGTIRDFS